MILGIYVFTVDGKSCWEICATEVQIIVCCVTVCALTFVAPLHL